MKWYYRAMYYYKKETMIKKAPAIIHENKNISSSFFSHLWFLFKIIQRASAKIPESIHSSFT